MSTRYFLLPQVLRLVCRFDKWRISPLGISSIIFLAPCAVLLVLKSYFLSAIIVQVSLFSFIVGIIVSVYILPQFSGNSIRLVVRDNVSKRQENLWLNSRSESVGSVKDRVRKAFGISSDFQVFLEGGRGSFIDSSKDLLPFLPLLVSSSKVAGTDITGLSSVSCVVSIEELPSEPEVVDVIRPSKRVSFMSGNKNQN